MRGVIRTLPRLCCLWCSYSSTTTTTEQAPSSCSSSVHTVRPREDHEDLQGEEEDDGNDTLLIESIFGNHDSGYNHNLTSSARAVELTTAAAGMQQLTPTAARAMYAPCFTRGTSRP